MLDPAVLAESYGKGSSNKDVDAEPARAGLARRYVHKLPVFLHMILCDQKLGHGRRNDSRIATAKD